MLLKNVFWILHLTVPLILSCPQGYVWKPDTNLCFRIVAIFTSAETSNQTCKLHGGNLASIPDESTQQFIIKEVPKIGQFDGLLTLNNSWFGWIWFDLYLHRIDPTHTGDSYEYMYLTSAGARPTFSNWDVGYPTGMWGCVAMFQGYQNDYRWRDVNCSFVGFALCSFEKPSTSLTSVATTTLTPIIQRSATTTEAPIESTTTTSQSHSITQGQTSTTVNFPTTSRVTSDISTPLTTESPTLCLCRCKTAFPSPPNVTNIQETLLGLKMELSISKKNTSASRRNLICAKDDRPSAQGIGAVGVVLLLLVAGIIIIPDAVTFCRFIINKIQ